MHVDIDSLGHFFLLALILSQVDSSGHSCMQTCRPVSETYTLTTTEEEDVGDHLPTPVMAATAMEAYSENVVYTEVNYENEAFGLPLNGYSQEAIMD